MKNVRTMVFLPMFAALITLCAWIALPVPPLTLTLQTLAVFLTLGVLGGKRGTGAIGIYLLLGLLGLPVFSGFRGGASALLGPTGGFLWGFLAAGLICWALEGLGTLPAMAAGHLVLYACGCLWFSCYAPGTGLWGAALVCVVPYLPLDVLKLALAWHLTGRLRRHLPR